MRKVKTKKSENDVETTNETNKQQQLVSPLFIIPPSSTAGETGGKSEEPSISVQFSQEMEGTSSEILLEVLRRLGEATQAVARFDSDAAIQAIDDLPIHLQRSPMALMLLARAHFEAANYRKAVEVFEECHRLHEHYWKGVEYYSTALWHLQSEVELSSLAQTMTDKFRTAPQARSSRIPK